jgi:hypothetical protein
MQCEIDDLRKPFWTKLRIIGNTSPAKAVILVPLIGHWIIFNNDLMDHAAIWRALGSVLNKF